MKNAILFFTLSFFVTTIIAQNKGASPIVQTRDSRLATQNTYAVVVGISDYQEKEIPDLRYADKDAEAFANFLRSNAGGRLDKDHLKVLLNKDATAAQFAIALDWLMEVAKENDQVILYFSGHGDVEKKTITQPGYLLCWDAPSRVYLAGGALALPMFQDIITTLSSQNKAKVVVITDACRSGKLAGSTVGGSQITGANLAKQYANEIKILSCQPHEYSIEGEQWGGGRGAFSYNLVNALYGLADNNNDLIVNLQEVGRYLEDHVTTEVAPVSQVPMILGNRTETLSKVDASLLASLKSGKLSQQNLLSAIDTRGMEEDVLAAVDTSVRLTYQLFKKALKDKNFLPVPTKEGEPANACADTYYELLIKESKIQRLHSTITRNYAAALQDEAQQTLNQWLKTSDEASFVANSEKRLPQKVFSDKIKSYPRCLDRAAELLGRNHYMYATLKARKYFFDGFILANSNKNPNRELGNQALSLFRKSLEWQANQPQVYWQMSMVFGYNLGQLDSLEKFTNLAIQLNPDWIRPYIDAVFCLSFRYKQQSRAKSYLEQAIKLDSTSAEILNVWATFNFGENNFEEAEIQLKKSILLDSTDIVPWINLVYMYRLKHRYEEAEKFVKKVLEMDSTSAIGWSVFGSLLMNINRINDAELAYKKAILLDSNYLAPYHNLGSLYFYTKRFYEAENLFIKCISLDSTSSQPFNALGLIFMNSNRYLESERLLKKSIELDSMNAAAWYNLGLLYNRTQRNSEEEAVLKKSIELNPTISNPWNQLGMLYNRTQRFSEAESVLKKGNELEPKNKSILNNLANLYLMTQRFPEADSILKFALNLDSMFYWTWKNLGKLYLQKQDFSVAEKFVEKAIAIDTNNSISYQLLGIIYLRNHNLIDARRHFLKALKLNPNYAEAMLGMAYLLQSEGKTEEAIHYVEQAISKGSTYEQLEKDEDLKSLRSHPKWNELMKKYFPDKVSK